MEEHLTERPEIAAAMVTFGERQTRIARIVPVEGVEIDRTEVEVGIRRRFPDVQLHAVSVVDELPAARDREAYYAVFSTPCGANKL